MLGYSFWRNSETLQEQSNVTNYSNNKSKAQTLENWIVFSIKFLTENLSRVVLIFEYSQKYSNVLCYNETYLFRQNLHRNPCLVIRAKVIVQNSPISWGSWKASDSGGGVRDTETYHARHAHSQTMQHCIHI